MKQNKKPKQGIARLLEISGEKDASMIVSVALSIAGTLFQMVPFLSVYQVMAELLRHTGTGANLDTDLMIRWALYGLGGLLAGYLLSYMGGMMSHTFAYDASFQFVSLQHFSPRFMIPYLYEKVCPLADFFDRLGPFLFRSGPWYNRENQSIRSVNLLSSTL